MQEVTQSLANAGNRPTVLGYPVDLCDKDEALARIENSWQEGKFCHVVTMNAEMVVQAQNDQNLDGIIREATLVVPDGAGVVWAIKLSGQGSGKPVVRVPGVELSKSCLSLASKHKLKVALLGGRPEVMDKLSELVKSDYQGINLVAAKNGYFKSEEEEQIVRELAKAQPQLVLVALGVPRQEFFIKKWKALFPSASLIGVGGSFDVWTGFVQRAPESFQKFHLEWLYRLLKEPWRAKRMASTLPNFALQVIWKMVLFKNQKK
jgi:N-acetylglucosaminyldiphosphoundecaprenol N-acetyl-beta-D-mannosaminyltransferase